MKMKETLMDRVQAILNEYGIPTDAPQNVIELAHSLAAARWANETLTARVKEAEKWTG